jgi:hypothetical protein
MRLLLVLIFSISLTFITKLSEACEFCTIAYMGKKEAQSEQDSRFTTKVFYEDQDWDEIPAADAHALHHQGHDAHDKQDEQITHTLLGFQATKRLSFDLDIPYVVRHYIEIDSHARLGKNETSHGLGDITLTGDYEFFQKADRSLGVMAGVKFPSGSTSENDSGGARIEPELQPGTGSYDYLFGLNGAIHPGTMDYSASAVYIYKTEGAQDFRHGDLFSVSLYAGKRLQLKDHMLLKWGVLLNNQLENKQEADGELVKDSGGYTMLIGPHVELSYSLATVEFSYLAPAVQELGGVHQELKGIWTGAMSVKF